MLGNKVLEDAFGLGIVADENENEASSVEGRDAMNNVRAMDDSRPRLIGHRVESSLSEIGYLASFVIAVQGNNHDGAQNVLVVVNVLNLGSIILRSTSKNPAHGVPRSGSLKETVQRADAIHANHAFQLTRSERYSEVSFSFTACNPSLLVGVRACLVDGEDADGSPNSVQWKHQDLQGECLAHGVIQHDQQGDRSRPYAMPT
jgi:hypothetical protein